MEAWFDGIEIGIWWDFSGVNGDLMEMWFNLIWWDWKYIRWDLKEISWYFMVYLMGAVVTL